MPYLNYLVCSKYSTFQRIEYIRHDNIRFYYTTRRLNKTN
nr:MAG TPA: hypothetical protein [Caudoviricetes sp.]